MSRHALVPTRDVVWSDTHVFYSPTPGCSCTTFPQRWLTALLVMPSMLRALQSCHKLESNLTAMSTLAGISKLCFCLLLCVFLIPGEVQHSA